MDSCSVLILGGGPAGSSCAWALARAGLDVTIVDRARFPRDKVCGGWITPQVLAELDIDPAVYARGRTMQPITGFRTSRIGQPGIFSDYGDVVSYGIRRREFDEYLLRRAGARVIEDEALWSLEKRGSEWTVNERFRAPLLIGAGGHFCPVAKHLGAKFGEEVIVAAQETEFEMTPEQARACRVQPEVPELYFCRDIKGYGWCFRKGDVLNVGLGRLDKHRISEHVAAFVEYLKRAGRVPFDLPSRIQGHAYLLFDRSTRPVVSDGVLLVGDAAGLSYSQSGEGIRPAIESGLLAAQVIAEAEGDYSAARLSPYRDALHQRFGTSANEWFMGIGKKLSPGLQDAIGGALLRTSWFSRRVVLDRWFLHRDDPPLRAESRATVLAQPA